MEQGERQVAPTLDGIRDDHLSRYRFAASRLAGKRVIDAGCGVGYGSMILAEAGCQVLAVDNCREALDYAEKHYAHENITYQECDLAKWKYAPTYDAAICFEVLEHLPAPGLVLSQLGKVVPLVLASVPNEDVFPHRGKVRFHERHYTPQEFEVLLNTAGWEVGEWFGQEDKMSDVVPLINGRTLIVTADAERNPMGETYKTLPPPPPGPPRRVAIVAQGHSKMAYFTEANKLGGYTKTLWDEVWAINSTGGVIKHDRLIHMDDVIVQEERARLNKEVAGITTWLKDHPGPIYTSTSAADVLDALVAYRGILAGLEPCDEVDEDGNTESQRIEEIIETLEERLPRYEAYPGLVSFPFTEVLADLSLPYLNNTVSYAIALALHMGVDEIWLYGVDFTYPDAHISEKGRACCEFLLGRASMMGCQVFVPPESTLLDANEPDHMRFYGYDGWDMTVRRDEGGEVRINKRPKPIPTAEEMEERYRKIPKHIEDQMRERGQLE